MNFRRIAQLEREFFAQNHAYNLQKRSIAFGQNETMELYECEPRMRPLDYFIPEEVEKKRIVLHFTAGHLQGDIATLTGGRGRVSVPFVIARDGKIYRLFSSRFWSYHLGPGAIGGNTPQSQATIGIELSNFGPLYALQDKLYCWTDRAYCSLQEKKQYLKLDQPFRGYQYFANYTSAQYQSLQVLLRYLTTTYSIPRAFLPDPLRLQTTAEVLDFAGIVSHINYRADKLDIGPAFDWGRVMAELNLHSPIRPANRNALLLQEDQMDEGKTFVAEDLQLAPLEGLGV
jgi:N-acetyl-anhydromuramyl-L-alanine amidase AmpD